MREPLGVLERLFVAIALGLASASCASAPSLPPASRANEDAFVRQETIEPYVSWRARRAAHRTQLAPLAAATSTASLTPRAGASLIHYPSGRSTLGGWFSGPGGDGPRPGVVYLHNDFQLELEAWRNAQPLIAAGYAVLLPALRGENGNPGVPELLYGEVDDACAAVRWLAAQPGVDPTRIYVIGHSIGGALASLVALDPPPGVRATADVGGVYRAHTFHRWAVSRSNARLVRFDLQDDEEVSLRLLIPHLRDLTRPHYSFAGRGDPFDTRYARLAAQRAAEVNAPLHFVAVDGGHSGSVAPAVERFIALIEADADRP